MVGYVRRDGRSSVHDGGLMSVVLWRLWRLQSATQLSLSLNVGETMLKLPPEVLPTQVRVERQRGSLVTRHAPVISQPSQVAMACLEAAQRPLTAFWSQNSAR